MARKKNLTEAFAGERQREPTTATPPPEPAARAGATPPSRQGRKAMTLYLDPAAHKQLKLLAIDRDQPAHALLLEAVDDLFRKHGKAPIAKPPE